MKKNSCIFILKTYGWFSIQKENNTVLISTNRKKSHKIISIDVKIN